MNLPNRLTVLRMILIPVVAALLLLAPDGGWLFWLFGGLVFGAAAITDALDGSIARRRGIITDFGKLMDPVADKLLVTAALTCLVSVGLCPPWVLIIVLAREFLVTSIRLVSASRGVVIPANNWGKIKTVIQIISIVAVIVFELLLDVITFIPLNIDPASLENVARFTEESVMWLTAAITVVSGLTYAKGARKLFSDK